jgi:hypothetical protein
VAIRRFVPVVAGQSWLHWDKPEWWPWKLLWGRPRVVAKFGLQRSGSGCFADPQPDRRTELMVYGADRRFQH